MITMTPQELKETINDIRQRVNDPAYKAYYVNWDGKGHQTWNSDAHDDLEFLLDLVNQLSPDCFELTPAARELLGVGND